MNLVFYLIAIILLKRAVFLPAREGTSSSNIIVGEVNPEFAMVSVMKPFMVLLALALQIMKPKKSRAI